MSIQPINQYNFLSYDEITDPHTQNSNISDNEDDASSVCSECSVYSSALPDPDCTEEDDCEHCEEKQRVSVFNELPFSCELQNKLNINGKS